MKFFKTSTQYFPIKESYQLALNYVEKLPWKENDYIQQLATLKNMMDKYKRPNWILPFAKFRFDQEDGNGKSFADLESLLRELVEKKDLLNLLPMPVIQYDNYEKLLDGMIQIERYQRAKKIIDKIPNPALRQELLKKENLEKVKNIADLIVKVSSEVLQSNFYKKASAYKTAADVIQALTQLVKRDSLPKLKAKIEKSGGKVFFVDEVNKLVVAQINTFESCKKLGPKAWCICRDKDVFAEYIDLGFNRQFIIYDLSIPATDTLSVVGITVTPDGIIKASHRSNDDEISPKELTTYFNTIPWDAMLRKYTPEEIDSMVEQLIHPDSGISETSKIDLIIARGSETVIKEKMLEYADLGLSWFVMAKLLEADKIEAFKYVFSEVNITTSKNISFFIRDLLYNKYNDIKPKIVLVLLKRKNLDINELLDSSEERKIVSDLIQAAFFYLTVNSEDKLTKAMSRLQLVYDLGITKPSFWGKVRIDVAARSVEDGTFGADRSGAGQLRSSIIDFSLEKEGKKIVNDKILPISKL